MATSWISLAWLAGSALVVGFGWTVGCWIGGRITGLAK